MNKNTKNSESEIPDEVLELLPWYAIGKLSVDDQAFFEKMLVTYPSLQFQLEEEQKVISKVSANNSVLDKSLIPPADERLKSVFIMIDVAEKLNKTKEREQVNQTGSLLEKFKNTIDTLIPVGVPQYARIASVGILVLSVAVLTAFVAPLFTQSSEFIPASAVTQPLDQKTTLINASQTVLLVGFNGSSTELGNNEVLKGKLSKIESVPNKEGVYQISFKQVLNSEETSQVIGALMKQDKLIWFAGEEF